MSLRLGPLPHSPVPQRGLQARNRLVDYLAATHTTAAEQHELWLEQRRRVRQCLAAERLASRKKAVKASVTPAKGRSTRRAVKRLLRAERRACIRAAIESVLAGRRRAACEARRALAESLAARRMQAESNRRQGLANTRVDSDHVVGYEPEIDSASSPRKVRGPNTAGRPRFVVHLRELSL